MAKQGARASHVEQPGQGRKIGYWSGPTMMKKTTILSECGKQQQA